MEKQRVRKFKNRQKRLAKKLAKALGYELESIKYVEYLPGASYDWDTRKIILKEKAQIYIPGSKIIPGKKHRIIVIINFKEDCVSKDIKIINSVMKRYFILYAGGIAYSVNPHSI